MPGITVVVTGACGKVGREVVKAVLGAEDLKLVGAVDKQFVGQDVAEIVGLGHCGITISEDLRAVLKESSPSVMVDFTRAEAAMTNIRVAIENETSPVVGTTGLPQEFIEEVGVVSAERGLGAVIAPNFAIGAVLMMKFCEIAARFLPDVEIIELHHNTKIDAPSGTAIKTAKIIAERIKKGENLEGTEQNFSQTARGIDIGKVRVHSVRLPGLVAHQEVIFGGLGQILTIRHDSTSRESFIPGVLLAIRKAPELTGLVYGLEGLLDL